jgi:hypothetical protein
VGDDAGGIVADTLESGDKVEIRRRFDDLWTRGFEVIDVTDAGLRVRRLSDGAELPTVFRDEEVRRESKQDSFWWQ